MNIRALIRNIRHNRKRSIFIAFLIMIIAAAGWGQSHSIPATDIERPYDLRKLRTQDQTYLTFPEWFIVYSSDEYAQFIKDKPPSGFPYLRSSLQYWKYYRQLYKATKDNYPFNSQYNIMLCVIGSSMTLEYIVKFIWEETIGRLAEMTRAHGMTDEEKFAYETARDYVDFIRIYPWYEYNFAGRLKKLWTTTSLTGDDLIRKWERKFFLTLEYSGKAAYGWILGGFTRISYEEEPLITFAEVSNIPKELLARDQNIKFVAQDKDLMIVSMPRYDAFLKQASFLAENGIDFKSVEGNSVILMTIIAPKDWYVADGIGREIFSYPILTDPNHKRIGLELPVPHMKQVITDIEKSPAKIEHIYDY